MLPTVYCRWKVHAASEFREGPVCVVWIWLRVSCLNDAERDEMTRLDAKDWGKASAKRRPVALVACWLTRLRAGLYT